MNKSPSIKNCPFCKNQIPDNAEKCPICKMTLIERVEIIIKENRHSVDTNPNTENNQHPSAVTDNSSSSAQEYITKVIEFFKRKKGSLVFYTIVILLTLYFTRSNRSIIPEQTLYNYELDGQNKSNEDRNSNSINNDKPKNVYTPSILEHEMGSPTSENESSSNQETIDIIDTPEKYIPNGKIFYKNKRYFTGLGELSIKNGTDNDAVVKLVSSNINKAVLSIYIRRNSAFTITNIIDGNYKLFFVVGKHYDEDSLIFLKDCSFAVFEENFPFMTDEYRTEEKIKTKYSIFEITLHPVVGGKARTDEISKNEFLFL